MGFDRKLSDTTEELIKADPRLYHGYKAFLKIGKFIMDTKGMVVPVTICAGRKRFGKPQFLIRAHDASRATGRAVGLGEKWVDRHGLIMDHEYNYMALAAKYIPFLVGEVPA